MIIVLDLIDQVEAAQIMVLRFYRREIIHVRARGREWYIRHAAKAMVF
jgi:hypothetical protein